MLSAARFDQISREHVLDLDRFAALLPAEQALVTQLVAVLLERDRDATYALAVAQGSLIANGILCSKDAVERKRKLNALKDLTDDA